MIKIKDILNLIRIKHWIKNVLIIIPLFFSIPTLNNSIILNTLLGLFSFCLISSSIYIYNDICDKDLDQKHKIKSNRPIAKGVIKISHAYIIMIVLLIISITINIIFIHNIYGVALIFIYFILNILYSLKIKNIPMLDIIALVSCFIIRLLYGAFITNIVISKWLYLTVMFISFFMVFGKRRNEIIMQKNISRKVLKYYNENFLDKYMNISLVLSLVFYSLWTIDSETVLRHGNDYIIYTVPLVFIIFMRYSLILEGKSYGDPVDILTTDKILIYLIIIYLTILILIMYIL